MTAASLATNVKTVQAIGDNILATIAGLDPAVAPEAALAGVALDLTAEMVAAALMAWSDASGQPITAETIAALLPNPTPLTEPDSQ